jgi:hypothetical protein
MTVNLPAFYSAVMNQCKPVLTAISETIKSIDHVRLEGVIMSLLLVVGSKFLNVPEAKSAVDLLMSLDAANNYQTINNWRHPALKVGFMHLLCIPAAKIFSFRNGEEVVRGDRIAWFLGPSQRSPKPESAPASTYVGHLDINAPSPFGTPYTFSLGHAFSKSEFHRMLVNRGADVDPLRGVEPHPNLVELADGVIVTKGMVKEILSARTKSGK